MSKNAEKRREKQEKIWKLGRAYDKFHILKETLCMRNWLREIEQINC